LAIYEQDFMSCSFGGHPGRGAHQVLATLHEKIAGGKIEWVLEADLIVADAKVAMTTKNKKSLNSVRNGSPLSVFFEPTISTHDSHVSHDFSST